MPSTRGDTASRESGWAFHPQYRPCHLGVSLLGELPRELRWHARAHRLRFSREPSRCRKHSCRCSVASSCIIDRRVTKGRSLEMIRPCSLPPPPPGSSNHLKSRLQLPTPALAHESGPDYPRIAYDPARWEGRVVASRHMKPWRTKPHGDVLPESTFRAESPPPRELRPVGDGTPRPPPATVTSRLVAGRARPAGFRDRAEVLDSTFLRMGMLAVLRSR